MESFYHKQPYPAQNMCKKHCNITYSLVRTVSLDPWDMCSDLGYVLRFKFDKEVVYSKKVLSYTVYNFLVDIGGSMGLWLGKYYKPKIIIIIIKVEFIILTTRSPPYLTKGMIYYFQKWFLKDACNFGHSNGYCHFLFRIQTLDIIFRALCVWIIRNGIWSFL